MPPKGKGLSMNEKRDRLLKIFTTKVLKEVFSYAQIEKEAGKVGIRSDVVKEVLESLVSDTLVDQDTLGVSKCYWALPSQAFIRIQQKVTEKSNQLITQSERRAELEKQLEQTKQGREINEIRTIKEKQLAEIKLKNQKMNQQLELYRRSDPERIKQLIEDTKKLKDEANKWTDNIIQLMYYLSSQGGFSSDQIKELGLPAEIENI